MSEPTAAELADLKAIALAQKIEKNARDLIDPLRAMFRINRWTKEMKAIMILAVQLELRKLEREHT